MRGFIKKRSQKTGLPPGTLVHIGERRAGAVEFQVTHYDAERVEHRVVAQLDECLPWLKRPGVTWVHAAGAFDARAIQQLASFGLHPLVLEDIMNTDQRTKFDEYGDYAFIVLKLLHAGDAEIASEQISIALGKNFVISVEESPSNAFGAVRDMIEHDRGRVRRAGADYLAYLLLDSVVDAHFEVLEKLGERIEALQDEMVDKPTPDTLRALHRLRREALLVRKSIWPLRSVLSEIERARSPLFREDTWIYLRDVYDHTVHIVDNIETFREMLSGLLDLYLSSATNRLNEVIKVLTVISTIFIPPSFIASVYGMNFRHMPELAWPWGYAAAWVAMIALATGTLVYLKKKRWL